MKKITAAFFLLLLPLTVSFASDWLSVTKNERGEIIIDNSHGDVEDRIRFLNKTDSIINITIAAKHKKSKQINLLASATIKPKDTQFVNSSYNDNLDDFSYFIVTTSNGEIIACKAESSHDDLYFYIDEFSASDSQYQTASSGTKNSSQSTNQALDELLKWKQLLDAGVITQVEFDIKKRELLGL